MTFLKRLLWWRRPVDRGKLDMELWRPTTGCLLDADGSRTK